MRKLVFTLLFLLNCSLIFAQERDTEIRFKGAYTNTSFVGHSYAAGFTFFMPDFHWDRNMKFEVLYIRGGGNDFSLTRRVFASQVPSLGTPVATIDSYFNASWQFLGKAGWQVAEFDGKAVFFNVEALGGSTTGVTESFSTDRVLPGNEDEGSYFALGCGFDLEIPLSDVLILNPEVAAGTNLIFTSPWPQENFYGRPAYYRASVGLQIKF